MAILLSITLTGCASQDGDTLSCPGPGATGCDSLDTVYQRSAGTVTSAGEDALRRIRVVPGAVVPGFLPPRVVRVWLAPWEDEEGDLHDYQYIYLVITQARWDVDYVTLPAE